MLQNLVRQNPESFKIPLSVLENPDEWKLVMRLLGQLLSRVRGSLKERVRAFIRLRSLLTIIQVMQSIPGFVSRTRNVRTEPQNIVDLTRSIFALAPHVEIESAHYPRIAFLVRTVLSMT